MSQSDCNQQKKSEFEDSSELIKDVSGAVASPVGFLNHMSDLSRQFYWERTGWLPCWLSLLSRLANRDL